MKILIKNANIINEGCITKGHILIEGDIIADILPQDSPQLSTIVLSENDEVMDADGLFVLPGVIDTHVHFREPGLTHKADIESESRAAVYGGVTSYFDMPNTKPQTTDFQALEEKYAIARKNSHVNYSFFFGATNDNTALLHNIDKTKVPGIKLFMGSSTGNMLVDNTESLHTLFETAAKEGLLVMSHCEDTQIINTNTESLKGNNDDLPVTLHPQIRSEKACYESTKKAVELASEHDTRLHIAHVTTAKELIFFGKSDNITCEVTPAHLLFSDADYITLGTKIKCNPAVKSLSDRNALRNALSKGIIRTIATDHAPHTLDEKNGGALKAVSGMPMLQFSLIAMLSLTDEGVLTKEQVVELMCHAPAKLFKIKHRGFIRKGYKADITIVGNQRKWTVQSSDIKSKCGWSPLEGHSLGWQVVHTICNGKHILSNGVFNEECRGEQIEFEP